MFSKYNIVIYVYHIHYIFLIVLFYELKNFQFYTSLIIIFLFIFNNFDSNLSFFFMIYAAKSSSKGSFSKKFNNFISVTYMISNYNFIISIFIIITIIIYKILFFILLIFAMSAATTVLIMNFFFISILLIRFIINFNTFLFTNKINHIKIKYFSFFIIS